jgi:hydroxymethylpyrimidine pyrophosphatase-like HAD family hydrolase
MIKAAALGSAVNNAHDEVKKIADYIAENDNEHSAVAEVIEKFVLKNA